MAVRECHREDTMMHSHASLAPVPTTGESYVLHQPVAHGLGLMDCAVPYPFQGVVGGAPASPAPSLPWSNSISAQLPMQQHQQHQHHHHHPATPDACASRSSVAYECLPAYQAPPSPASTSVESAYALVSTCVPETSPSPNAPASVSLSHRSSLSSGAEHSGSGFVSPPETDQSFRTAALTGGASSPEWLVHHAGDLSMQVSLSQEAQARVVQALLPPSSSSAAGSPSIQPMEGAVHGAAAAAAYERPRRYTHEDVSYDDGASPALSSQDSRSGSLSRIQFPVSGSAANPMRRRRRQLTTKAEANHECEICGKFFERRYNYRAHLATHDPERVYAHVCQVTWCDKKFVRKTDLTRHHQSVHLKQRDYQCEMCGHLFARKDTLRRHTEDGCSKRFQLRPDMFQMSSPSNNPSCRVSPCSMPSPASSSAIPIELGHAGDVLLPPGAGMCTEAESACISFQPTTDAPVTTAGGVAHGGAIHAHAMHGAVAAEAGCYW